MLNGTLSLVEVLAWVLSCLLQSSLRCVFLLTFNCMTSENLISRKPIYYFNAHLALLFSQSNLFVSESLRRVEKQAKKSFIFFFWPSKEAEMKHSKSCFLLGAGGGGSKGDREGRRRELGGHLLALVPDGKQSRKLPLNSSVPANRALSLFGVT